MTTRHRRLLAPLALLLLATGLSEARADQAQAREPAERPTASSLLEPAQRKGPHHQVAEVVTLDGYFYRFTLTSAFGPFDAIGRSMLAVRIQEIGALAALAEVSTTEVFLAAAGRSIAAVGQNAAAVVTDPAAAAKGIGGGIKRAGVNLGRRTQRAVASIGDDEGADAAQGPPGAGVATSVLGVNAAARRWAQKIGVDPYTSNPALRKALDDIAKVDAAGSIATKVVLPIPKVVGMTSSVGSLVWGKDPEELRKINEQRLRELAAPAPVTAALLANRWFTLTYQTRLIAALHAVKVPGTADYLHTASEAATEREALFFVESAELLAQQHAREPVSGILADSRAIVASGRNGVVRVLLPVDWVATTPATRTSVQDIAARARRELGGRRLELMATGQVSPAARKDLAANGWRIDTLFSEKATP